VNNIEILIFNEANRQIYFKYSLVHQYEYGEITADVANNKFIFSLGADYTESAPIGAYYVKIKTSTISDDFPAEGLISIEQGHIFTIEAPVKAPTV
jgi:hypothetical protein